MAEVANVKFSILPTFKGFRKAADAEASASGKAAGSSFKKGFAGTAKAIATPALTKLKADVNAAARSYRAAMDKQSVAAGRVRVAEAKLQELRASGKARQSQLIAAEERLRTARNAQTAATAKVTTAANTLKVAQSSLATATAKAAQEGQRGASRFAQGWQSIRGKVGAAVKGALSSVGRTSTGQSAAEGRRSGNAFASGFSSAARTVSGRLRGLGASILAGLGLAGIGVMITRTLASSISKGLGRLESVDNATKKLTGLGHSAKSVKSIMTNALNSVKGTAFGLDEAATTAAGTVAAGIKPGKELERTLKLVADAATIGGTSMGEMGAIFNKVATANKVQGDVINQLNDKGIPIVQLLAKVTGKSAAEVSKLASQGKIDFATFQKAMEEGLGGAALKSGETFSGSLANMKAALSRLGASLLEGIFPQLAPMFQRLTKFFDQGGPAAKRWGDALGAAFSGVVTAVGNVARAVSVGWAAITGQSEVGEFDGILGAINNVAATAYDTFSRVGDMVGPMLSGLAAQVGPALSGLQGQIGPVLEGIIAAVEPILAGLGPALLDAITPIAEVIPQLFAGLAEAGPQLSPLMVVLNALAPIVPQLAQAVSALGAAFASILSSALASVLPVLVQLGALVTTQIVPALSTLIGSVLPPLSALFGVVAQVLGQVLAAVMPLVSALLTVLVPVISQLVTLIAPLIAQLATALAPVLQLIGMLFSVVAQVLTAVLVPAISALMPIVTTVFGVVVSIITAALQIITGIINLFVGLLTGNWQQAWDGIRGIVEGQFALILAILKGALDLVVSIVKGVVNLVVGIWTGWFNLLRGTADRAARAIASVFLGMAQKTINFTRNLVSAVTSVWRTLTSAMSNAASLIRNRVVSAFSSLVSGVTGRVSSMLSAVRGIPGRVKSALGNMGSLLTGAGRDLIRGLLGGIREMAGNVASTARDVVSGAVSAAKNALGIKSPSRVFAEIGRQTGMGMIVGMDGSASDVADAGKLLAQASVPDAGVNVGRRAGWAGLDYERLATAIAVAMKLSPQPVSMPKSALQAQVEAGVRTMAGRTD